MFVYDNIQFHRRWSSAESNEGDDKAFRIIQSFIANDVFPFITSMLYSDYEISLETCWCVAVTDAMHVNSHSSTLLISLQAGDQFISLGFVREISSKYYETSTPPNSVA